MAARFNSLSLDNDHIYSSNGFPVHSENPRWQQAYTQLKELQRRYHGSFVLLKKVGSGMQNIMTSSHKAFSVSGSLKMEQVRKPTLQKKS